MRDYGLTNEAAYASAPAVGPAGDSYWNTTGKVLYVSDGSVWNAVGPGAGGPPTGAVPAGDLQGSYPSPTIKPSALPWSISGGTLTPTDATKTVSIPATANVPNATPTLLLGANLAKARIQSHNPQYVLAEMSTNYDAYTGILDDNTKSAWALRLGDAQDRAVIRRAPPTGGMVDLLTLSSAGVLTLPGDTANGNALVVGSLAIKGRLFANQTTSGLTYLTSNYRIVGTTPTQDDTSKASWSMILRSDADVVQWHRQAAGAATTQAVAAIGTNSLTYTAVDPATAYIVATGYGVQWGGVYQGRQARGTQASPTASLSGDILLELSGNGYSTAFNTGGVLRFIAGENWSATARGTQMWIYVTPNGTTTFGGNYGYLDGGGNWVISGPVGQKSAGTTWQNPSDPRLKTAVAPYQQGLDAICRLEPIEYTLKAHPDGPRCYGFDAAAVRDVFPECISETRMKLDPADEEETDGVLVFDMSPILVALVNAVKELKEKVQ